MPAVNLDLSGRRAVVTGAASGIGRACAERLAKAQAEVLVVDIDEEATRLAAEHVGGEPLVMDLSGTSELASLKLDADILVNNAGFQYVAPITEFPPEVFARMLRVMVEAPFLLTRAVLPGMYERKFGRVINISSHLGIRATSFKVGYVTAKHALVGLSKAIALEGAAHGVTSNAICPSYVRTPLVEGQVDQQARAHGIPREEVLEKIFLASPAIKRLAETDEVAELVAFLCSPAASFITGAEYNLDGGASAH